MPSAMNLGIRLLRQLPSSMTGAVQALAAFGIVPSELISFASWADLWRDDGLHSLQRHVTSLKLLRHDECRVVLLASIAMYCATGKLRARHKLTINVLATGEVVLVNEATAMSQLQSLPRVGLHVSLPQSLSEFEWFGRGPHECYPDRCSGAMVGQHSATIDELFTPYLHVHAHVSE